MSLLGRFNDLISGQPAGTSDGIAAKDAAADAQLAVLNQQTAQRIADTQGDDAAAAYMAQVNADYAAQNDSSVTGQALQIDTGFASGVLDAAANPVDSFSNGLQWEGAQVGSIAGQVAGATANAAKSAFLGTASKIPWWVWVAGAVAIFVWLGGGGFVERKARRSLSR